LAESHGGRKRTGGALGFLGLAWLFGALAETLAEAVPVEIFMVALELA